MSELQSPGFMDGLLARMEAGRTQLYAGLRTLSDAQWREPITAADWSICDHLAHIAIWMEGVEAMLHGRSRWEVMGAGPTRPGFGFDELNEQLRTPHRTTSPAEVRTWLDSVHERMAATLRGMTPEQLQLPYSHYQPHEQRPDAGSPVLNWVIADTYGHYEEHRLWIEEAMVARGWPVAEEETHPSSVAALRARVDAEWSMLAQALGDLTAADMTSDRGEGWSLGDHLAHIAAWEQGISGLLRRQSRWRSMGVEPADLAEQSVDSINAAVIELHRGKPAGEVIALRDAAHQHLLEVLAGLTDADLSRPYSEFDPAETRFPTDRPIIRWIAGDTYEHYRDHRLWLARR